MKPLAVIALLSFSLAVYSQDCHLVKRTTKKSAETPRVGGSAASKDHILLYLEKIRTESPADTLNFSAMIIIGSRYVLKDSIITAGGKFEFLLSSGDTLTWNKAEASNLGAVLMSGYPNHVMFTVRASIHQLAPLTRNYITRLRVFDMVETDFGTKAQRQLLTIADCLSKRGDIWE